MRIKMKKLITLFTIIILAIAANKSMASDSKNAMDKVESIIKEAINKKGVDGKININIKGYDDGFKLRDELESYNISVDDIDLNEKAHSFKACVVFVSSDN